MKARPRAVIAAPNYWTSTLRVGTHQIARVLVELGWDVAYLSDPLTPFHVAKVARMDIRDRWRLARSGGSRDLGGHLVAWLPTTLVSPRAPIANFASRYAGGWLDRSGPRLQRWLRNNGFDQPDLLWIDSVIWDHLPGLANPRRSVLRIADQGGGFPRHRPEFDAMERRLASRVDLVVYTAVGLRDHVERLGPRRMQQMPNGVDLARFRGPMEEPRDLTLIPEPRVMYVGAMDEWFDYRLVSSLASAMPSVAFVMIGPEHLARSRFPALPNLYLLGSRSPSAVPAYLQHANVGLIPFDVRGHAELVHSIQPLKLYEYLASGLPVVAARWAEIEALSSPAKLYTTAEQAHSAIAAALERGTDGGIGREWVRSADWAMRLDPVLQSLGLAHLNREPL